VNSDPWSACCGRYATFGATFSALHHPIDFQTSRSRQDQNGNLRRRTQAGWLKKKKERDCKGQGKGATAALLYPIASAVGYRRSWSPISLYSSHLHMVLLVRFFKIDFKLTDAEIETYFAMMMFRESGLMMMINMGC